jgi:hypothetical protein
MPEFCRYCGAGIGPFYREGEGTCHKCDPATNKPNCGCGEPGCYELTEANLAKLGITATPEEWWAMLNKKNNEETARIGLETGGLPK